MYDAIVIGIGGMGSAAVYNLAVRGAKVLGLEQFNIPHELGASHGINRIIRLAYSEDPRYVPLLRRAYELWHQLEHLANERLLFITGGIDAGPANGNIVRGSLLSCNAHHLSHEVFDAAALNRKFPGFNLAADMLAVYQQDGGFVLAERSIVNYVIGAQQLGAEIHGREHVLEWEANPDRVRVRTDRDRYVGRKLIVTAGPWASTVLPELAELVIPERQVLIWTQPLVPNRFRLGAFPVFNMEGDEGRFYGFPVWGIPGFKIGKYHHRGELVPDVGRMDRQFHAEDEEVLRQAIRRYFPDANGPTLSVTTCLFSNSPDEHFILDLHPDFSNVAVAAGFSGHGFKFCSVVGEIMAELALEGGTKHDIRPFRLRRFANRL